MAPLRRVKIIEQSLGLNIVRGSSRGRYSLSNQDAMIRTLEEELDDFKQGFRGFYLQDLRLSEKFHNKFEECFDRIGPMLWPTQDNERTWLVDAALDGLDGHYPQNLEFDNPEDRALLHNNLFELVLAKVSKHTQNRDYANMQKRLLSDLYHKTHADDQQTPSRDGTPGDDDNIKLHSGTTGRQEQDMNQQNVDWHPVNEGYMFRAPVAQMLPRSATDSNNGAASSDAAHDEDIARESSFTSTIFADDDDDFQADAGFTGPLPSVEYDAPYYLRSAGEADEHEKTLDQHSQQRFLNRSRAQESDECVSKNVVLHFQPRKFMFTAGRIRRNLNYIEISDDESDVEPSGIADKHSTELDSHIKEDVEMEDMVEGDRASSSANNSTVAQQDTPRGDTNADLPSPASNASLQHDQLPPTANTEPVGAIEPETQQPSPQKLHHQRRLNIKLVVEGSPYQQFVSIDLDLSVDDCFAKVQARLNRTLENRQVAALSLLLVAERDSAAPFLIEPDDFVTWENFVEQAAALGGFKIQAIADVLL